MREHHQYYHKEFVLEDATTLIVDFDFIPDPIEPTDEQILALIPHKCEACCGADPDLRDPGCRYGEPGETGENCPCWFADTDVYDAAYIKWWLDFHEKTMKGKPVPFLREDMGWPDDYSFVIYPESD